MIPIFYPAAELANAGYSVIVLEKGKYIFPADLKLDMESGVELFENKGVLQSESGNIVVMAGSGFGGGTAVNW